MTDAEFGLERAQVERVPIADPAAEHPVGDGLHGRPVNPPRA
ncbi:hypothetical protein ACFWVU_30770 [Streptomyces sp. NPDC058686]